MIHQRLDEDIRPAQELRVSGNGCGAGHANVLSQQSVTGEQVASKRDCTGTNPQTYEIMPHSAGKQLRAQAANWFAHPWGRLAACQSRDYWSQFSNRPRKMSRTACECGRNK